MSLQLLQKEMKYLFVSLVFALGVILLTCNIARVLRLLASVDFVVESGADAWEANKTTTAMASAPVAAGHRFV